MKFMRFFVLMSVLCLSANVKAGQIKEIYTTVQEEVEFYYQATGEWNVLKVSDMSFITSDVDSFILVQAIATIRNINTGIGKQETCLISFESESLEFTSINCF